MATKNSKGQASNATKSHLAIVRPCCSECGSERLANVYKDENGGTVDETRTLALAASLLADYLASLAASECRPNTAMRAHIASVTAGIHSMWAAREASYIRDAAGNVGPSDVQLENIRVAEEGC